MRKIVIVFVAIILVLFIGYKYLYHEHRDISAETAAFSVSVNQLLTEFTEDETKANSKYLDKSIVIKGKVTSVDSPNKTIVLDEKAFVIPVFDLNSEIKEDLKETNSRNNEIDFSKFLFQKQTHNDTPQKSKPNNNKNELEIDLHIEELLDDYSGMNNGQIIQVQLNHLQKAINKAIANRYKKLIVIHGIGNGRLKQEVRSVLSLQNLQYFDGKYSQYGYGATEVIIGS